MPAKYDTPFQEGMPSFWRRGRRHTLTHRRVTNGKGKKNLADGPATLNWEMSRPGGKKEAILSNEKVQEKKSAGNKTGAAQVNRNSHKLSCMSERRYKGGLARP